MKITRLNLKDKFSTFLFLSDSQRNIFIWQQDLKLKLNFEKLIPKKVTDAEQIAYQFLSLVRENQQTLLNNHLSSYLQEPCYWAAKQVYLSKKDTLNLLTLEECFGSGNEATIQPNKILKKYQINAGSKITTYAQIRLKTLITDTVYRNRKWKLLTNWGLLKKLSKSKRKLVLTEIAGLKKEQLSEYLLIWQCYVDNAITLVKNKHNRLSAPSLSQLQLMTSQYNLLAPKIGLLSSALTVDEFNNRLEFCAQQARKFINPQTISYEDESKNIEPEIIESNFNEIANQQNIYLLNQIMADIFHDLDLKFKAILYLYLGLNLTQNEVIKILQTFAPDFIKQQYQFSRKLNTIKKQFLDNLLVQIKDNQGKQTLSDRQILLQCIEQWLQEYIESQILLLSQQSYQQLDRHRQNKLRQSYQNQALDESPIINELINNLYQQLSEKLKFLLPQSKNIDQSFNLWLEKFFHQYFNQIN